MEEQTALRDNAEMNDASSPLPTYRLAHQLCQVTFFFAKDKPNDQWRKGY